MPIVRRYGDVTVFYPEFEPAELVRRLRLGAQRLAFQLPLVRVVLIGSWARGNYTAASDIDLLVVYHDPAREDAFSRVMDAFEVPRLEPHVYTREQARRLGPTLERMQKGGVAIYG